MKTNINKTGKPVRLMFKKDEEKYVGMYVTQRKFGSKKIIAADKNALKAYKKAQKLGVKEPVIFWVPPRGAKFIFNADAAKQSKLKRLAEKIRQWAESSSGQKAIKEALKKSAEMNAKIQEATMVTREDLHEPMSI